MNDILQQIVNAFVPILCLLITAGGAYLVALLRRRTAQLKQEIGNQTAGKYISLASSAVTQAVTYTAQTFVDYLKNEGAFDETAQAQAFEKAKMAVLDILGDTAVEALGEIYGDVDRWIETKIEAEVRKLKLLETAGK